MVQYNAWGWIGSSATTGISATGGSDIESGINGTSYDADGTDLTHAPYGTIVFDDGNGDDRIRDTDTDDSGGTTPAGDRISTDGGVTFQQLNEVGLYENSTITYTRGNGDTGTLTGVTMRVFQLSDGTIIMRMTDTDAQAAYDSVGFLPHHADTINLGTWDGTDFVAMVPSSFDDNITCFATGTMILTDRGEVTVEDLQPGDLVHTLDNGFQPLRWIGSRRFSGLDLCLRPQLKPIRIRAGALGDGRPQTDLVVSPQHRVLITYRIAERMFGTSEVLIAARHLTALDGIELAEDLDGVEYWHFLFDDHQIVLSNGAPTESLYTGPQALKSVSEQARAEIFDIFPQLADSDHDRLPTPARILVPGRRAHHFAERMVKNGHELSVIPPSRPRPAFQRA